MRTTHVAFNSPDHIAIAQDLTGDGDPSDQCDHGTASAGEITGNARLGNNWRGVSAISVDSWDVYGNDCSVGSAHTVAGFEAAVSWADRVIVAEIQLNAGEASASSTAADAAFDAGSVVIAANGNFGPGAGTVRSPGNAHKAIGIGAADLQTDALMGYSGRGPSADGRFKPDLVFPTNIEAPRASSNTALGSFGGTSAATPVAGGAAGLLRNWMRGGVGSIDAGHVYSHMILGGQTAYPFNNNTGAGPFQLGTGGHAYWGKTNVDQRRARRHPDLHPGRQDEVRGLAVVARGDQRPQRHRPRADRAGRHGARLQHLRLQRLRARDGLQRRLRRHLEAADQGLLGQRDPEDLLVSPDPLTNTRSGSSSDASWRTKSAR